MSGISSRSDEWDIVAQRRRATRNDRHHQSNPVILTLSIAKGKNLLIYPYNPPLSF